MAAHVRVTFSDNAVRLKGSEILSITCCLYPFVSAIVGQTMTFFWMSSPTISSSPISLGACGAGAGVGACVVGASVGGDSVGNCVGGCVVGAFVGGDSVGACVGACMVGAGAGADVGVCMVGAAGGAFR